MHYLTDKMSENFAENAGEITLGSFPGRADTILGKTLPLKAPEYICATHSFPGKAPYSVYSFLSGPDSTAPQEAVGAEQGETFPLSVFQFLL